MKLDSLKKRLAVLEPEGGICPHCQALEAMSEEELDAEVARLDEILQDAIGNESGYNIYRRLEVGLAAPEGRARNEKFAT